MPIGPLSWSALSQEDNALLKLTLKYSPYSGGIAVTLPGRPVKTSSILHLDREWALRRT